jgi:hypothetical protein
MVGRKSFGGIFNRMPPADPAMILIREGERNVSFFRFDPSGKIDFGRLRSNERNNKARAV